MICLDNSVLRRLASPQQTPNVDGFLNDHRSEPWVIPATVAFEYYAYYDTQTDIRQQQRILNEHLDGTLPLTDSVASEAAQLQLLLQSHQISLGIADLLHAATAREAGVTFVTRDATDYDKDPLKQLMSIEIIDS
jgi:predicted nucleic acid-binding protein